MAIWRKDWKKMQFSKKAKLLLADEVILEKIQHPSEMVSCVIRDHDLGWWLDGVTPAAAREQAIDLCRQQISVDTFVLCVLQSCKYYGKKPKLKPLLSIALEEASPEYWDKLKLTVDRSFHILDGMEIDKGMRLIQLHCAVSEKRLEGLPRRLHFWKKPADRVFRVAKRK
jgi:hypothetical protein